MMNREEGVRRDSIWIYGTEAENDLYTTNFLKLLIQYRYVWSPSDRQEIKLSLPAEKLLFLNDMNLVLPDIDGFQASVSLSAIKEIYDKEIKRLLEASKKINESDLPWISLAHRLFREYPREGREISVKDFKKSEHLNFYSHLMDGDLLIISNRNLHLQAVHKEFIKFSNFISRPVYEKDFGVFLIPVFEYLYLLIRSQKGKSDADRFISNLKYMHLPSDVIDRLLQCETLEELQSLIISPGRIRVKLTKESYEILMNWLRSCFSASLEMFNILRVLHENFHIDLYEDNEAEEFFGGDEVRMKTLIKKWEDDFWAMKTQKKLESKVTTEGRTTLQSNVPDIMAQMMSELDIKTKRPETPSTSQMPETPSTSQMPETPSTSQMPETTKSSESIGSACNLELKGSTFKLRESARRYLDHVRNSGWDMDKIEQALLNPPDPNVADSSEIAAKDDQEMDILENSGQNESAAKDDQEMDFLENPGRNENAENEDDTQDNIDQDMNDVTTGGVKNKGHQAETKYQYFELTESYKSNFHTVNPLTISGKDVLCSSDVSRDLLYLACAFESCKICTWHLSGKNEDVYDFERNPIGTLRGHKGIVFALSIDSKRKRLISGSYDCSVRIWDIEKSEFLYEILSHKAPVYAVCASPNSKYFLTASEDKQILLFCYDDIYPFRTYIGHSMEAINCVKFHPNCSYFASASSDGHLFLFKINYDSCPVRMFSRHKSEVYTLSFSPCGKYLASGDIIGLLMIWDILTYTPIKIVETGKGIRNISYDNSGSFIATLFYYNSWRVYHIEEEKDPDFVIEARSTGVPKSVHFSDTNKMLIIQFLEADKSKIAEEKGKPKTKIIESPFCKQKKQM